MSHWWSQSMPSALVSFLGNCRSFWCSRVMCANTAPSRTPDEHLQIKPRSTPGCWASFLLQVWLLVLRANLETAQSRAPHFSLVAVGKVFQTCRGGAMARVDPHSAGAAFSRASPLWPLPGPAAWGCGGLCVLPGGVLLSHTAHPCSCTVCLSQFQ